MKGNVMQNQQPDIIDVWDSVAKNYDLIDVSEPDYRANLRVICESAGEPKGKSFCEVGCGSATNSSVLAGMGADITLVDISPKALEFARKYFEQRGLHANFANQDALNMEFRDSTFDVVWNAGVVEHFDDAGKIKLIAEMWRILRPGGTLLVKVPNRWDVPFMIYKAWALWRKTWPYGFEDDMTIARVLDLAKKAGVSNFQVFAYDPIVGWWFLKHGKRITQMLGLNTEKWHSRRSKFGHVICLCAHKKAT